MRICKVIFSTNRVDYLVPTLESFHKNLDFGNHEVYGIFIDDYPSGRNDGFIEAIAKKYGYNHVVLHKENLGLTSTWQELYDLLATMNFDYIWQQEDDVELLYPVHIDDLIKLFQTDPNLCHVAFKRQVWYPDEQLELLTNVDLPYKDYLYTTQNVFFNPMACLYPGWVSKVKYKACSNFCPSETVVMHILNQLTNYRSYTISLKRNDGSHIVNHIGEITKGKRMNDGEIGWEGFTWMDPKKEYCARTGLELDPK